MTNTQLALAVTAVFSLVAIVALYLFRNRVKLQMKGPAGVEMKLDADNDRSRAISAHDIVSRKGGLIASDTTGAGIDLARVDVETDVQVSVDEGKKKL